MVAPLKNYRAERGAERESSPATLGQDKRPCEKQTKTGPVHNKNTIQTHNTGSRTQVVNSPWLREIRGTGKPGLENQGIGNTGDWGTSHRSQDSNKSNRPLFLTGMQFFPAFNKKEKNSRAE
jgi:hypothetical protein